VLAFAKTFGVKVVDAKHSGDSAGWQQRDFISAFCGQGQLNKGIDGAVANLKQRLLNNIVFDPNQST
jgi:hypothetical protein